MGSDKNKLIWNIKPKETPLVIRNCNKCNKKMEFYCSELFRVNAQKKSIDIWLIYKCTHCDTTWNMPIFSRIPPNSLGVELQKRFENNDKDLVWEYGFNYDVLKRNNAEIRYNMDYLVEGDEIDEEADGQVHILIKSKYNLNLRMDKFLQNQLGVRRKNIDKLFEDNIIEIKEKDITEIKKYKIKNDLEISIDYKKIINF